MPNKYRTAWLAAAASRIRAGEPEELVMLAYGYIHITKNNEREEFVQREMARMKETHPLTAPFPLPVRRGLGQDGEEKKA
jgi:hypothetical protein